MTSDQTDNINSVEGTVIIEGISLGREAIPQYASGRHRETGYHYSEVTSSWWPKTKRHRSHNNIFYHNICIGSVNTIAVNDPMKLAQSLSQCNFFKHDITFCRKPISPDTKPPFLTTPN